MEGPAALRGVKNIASVQENMTDSLSCEQKWTPACKTEVMLAIFSVPPSATYAVHAVLRYSNGIQ